MTRKVPQVVQLIDQFSQFRAVHPDTNIRIYCHDDSETKQFASDLRGVLLAAGYKATGVGRPFVFMETLNAEHERKGMVVSDEPETEAKALHDLLRAAGFNAPLRHYHMHKPHEEGPSERQGVGRRVGTAELLIEIYREPE